MKYSAPKNQYRVIGIDSFNFPFEEYWVGDFKDLESAQAAALQEAGPMNPVVIYDHHGNVIDKVASK